MMLESEWVFGKLGPKHLEPGIQLSWARFAKSKTSLETREWHHRVTAGEYPHPLDVLLWIGQKLSETKLMKTWTSRIFSDKLDRKQVENLLSVTVALKLYLNLSDALFRLFCFAAGRSGYVPNVALVEVWWFVWGFPYWSAMIESSDTLFLFMFFLFCLRLFWVFLLAKLKPLSDSFFPQRVKEIFEMKPCRGFFELVENFSSW